MEGVKERREREREIGKTEKYIYLHHQAKNEQD